MPPSSSPRFSALRRCCLWGGLALLFQLLWASNTSPLNPIFHSDIAIYATIGEAMNKGLRLYTDVYDHKGPLQFLIYAAAAATGQLKLTLFCFGSLLLALSMELVFRIARLFCGKLASFGSVLIFLGCLTSVLAGGGNPEEWAMPLMLLPLLLVLRKIHGAGTSRLSFCGGVLIGCCAGLCFLLKANTAAPAAGAVAALACLQLSRGQWRDFGKLACSLFLGTALVCAPFCLYFAAQGRFGDFIGATLLHNLQYAQSSAAEGLNAGHLFEVSRQALIISLLLIPSLMLLLRRHLISGATAFCCAGTALLGTLNLYLGYAYSHYFMMYLPVVAVASPLLWLSYTEARQKKAHRRSFIFCVLLAAANYLPHGAAELRFTQTLNFCPQKHPAAQAMYDVRELCLQLKEAVPTKSSLWVAHFHPAAHLYTERTPYFKYIFDHQNAEGTFGQKMKAEEAQMLLCTPPQYIALPSAEQAEEPLRTLLSQNYSLVRRLHIGEASLELYHRR